MPRGMCLAEVVGGRSSEDPETWLGVRRGVLVLPAALNLALYGSLGDSIADLIDSGKDRFRLRSPPLTP